MKPSPPRADRLDLYRSILEKFLEGLSRNPSPIHIPAKQGLRRPFPGMNFHLTPELFLQHHGTTEFVCPSDRFHLQRGELALIPRGVPHGERARDGKKAFQALVLCFRSQNQITLIVSRRADQIPAVSFSDQFEGPQVSTALRYLDDASVIPDHSPTAEKQREALVFTCLASILDLLMSPRVEDSSEHEPHPKVSQCRELIGAYLNNPNLSAADLGRQMGCTPDHLSRCFRREMGMSLFAYLREQRLYRARDLLQHPDLNISEIAWACGFSSLNYFVRSFRQTLGRSPGRYRRDLLVGQSPRPAPSTLPRQRRPSSVSRTSSGFSALSTGRPRTT